ncbi:MAG TPA: hypothetical protein VMU93_02135 [Caulobacteraceae bacterium]|nr:hypothetical protein [Caulobacteraceae bacterium]
MSTADLHGRDSRVPALIAAAALHAGLLALVIFYPAPAAMLPIGSSVPINIVSSAQLAAARAAVEAPRVQTAAAPAPIPAAPPQPPAAEPAPPAFSPAPARRQAAAPASRPSVQPQPQAADHFNFNRLLKDIGSSRRAGGPAASSAQRGAARLETSPSPRVGAGVALTQADQQALAGLIQQYWHPACGVPGAESLFIKVAMRLAPDGHATSVDLGGLDRSADPVKAAAAIRARAAAYAFAPRVPSHLFGELFTITFDSKRACASG